MSDEDIEKLVETLKVEDGGLSCLEELEWGHDERGEVLTDALMTAPCARTLKAVTLCRGDAAVVAFCKCLSKGRFPVLTRLRFEVRDEPVLCVFGQALLTLAVKGSPCPLEKLWIDPYKVFDFEIIARVFEGGGFPRLEYLGVYDGNVDSKAFIKTQKALGPRAKLEQLKFRVDRGDEAEAFCQELADPSFFDIGGGESVAENRSQSRGPVADARGAGRCWGRGGGDS